MIKYLPHLVTILMAGLGGTAQIMLKKAMPLQLNPISLLTNGFLISGVALYGIAFIGYLAVLRYAPVSQLYPIIATSYVFVVIIASIVLSEPMTISKLIGSVLVVGGVALISF